MNSAHEEQWLSRLGKLGPAQKVNLTRARSRVEQSYYKTLSK